jgi:hypothetical protein
MTYTHILGIDPSNKDGNALVLIEAMRDRMDKAPRVVFIENGCGYLVAKGLFANGLVGKTLVAVERVKSMGQAGDSLLRTSEVVGGFREFAEVAGYASEPVFRSDVLRYLDVLGQKGNRDAQVKAAISQAYGFESWRGAVGKKSAPGPLYGIAGDGWAALGVALTAAYREVCGRLEGWGDGSS